MNGDFILAAAERRPVLLEKYIVVYFR